MPHNFFSDSVKNANKNKKGVSVGVKHFYETPSPLHSSGRRQLRKGCPAFQMADATGEVDGHTCDWNVAQQGCFESGASSTDGLSFNEIHVDCDMETMITVPSGKELRIRGSRVDKTGLFFQNNFHHPTCQPKVRNKVIDQQNNRHFMVEGKMVLMNMNLDGGYNYKAKFNCGSYSHLNPQNPSDMTWLEGNEAHCGGSIHVKNGGQVILLGVTFGTNLAWAGTTRTRCNSMTCTTNYNWANLPVYISPSSAMIALSTEANIQYQLWEPKEKKVNYGATLLAECTNAATDTCRTYFHRVSCFGGALSLKSTMYCGGDCTAGHFGPTLTEFSTNLALSVCKACPKGQFQANDGQPSCTRCSAGFYSSAVGQTSMATCLPCPDTTSSSPGATDASECGGCETGMENVGNAVSGPVCNICPAGRFQNENNPGPCKLCPKNTFNQDDRQTRYAHDDIEDCASCNIVNPGSFSPPGAQYCVECEPGKRTVRPFDGTAVTICEDCTPGRFQELIGNETCEVCPSGFYSTGTRSKYCIICAAGQYSAEDGASSCAECDIGQHRKFTDTPTSCLKCAAGLYMDKQRSTVSFFHFFFFSFFSFFLFFFCLLKLFLWLISVISLYSLFFSSFFLLLIIFVSFSFVPRVKLASTHLMKVVAHAQYAKLVGIESRPTWHHRASIAQQENTSRLLGNPHAFPVFQVSMVELLTTVLNVIFAHQVQHQKNLGVRRFAHLVQQGVRRPQKEARRVLIAMRENLRKL